MKRPSWASRVAMGSDADLGSLQKACPPRAALTTTRTPTSLLSAKLSANQPAQRQTSATLCTLEAPQSPASPGRASALTRKRSLVKSSIVHQYHPWSDAVSAHSLRRRRNICARATPTRLFVRVVWPMRQRSPPAGYNDAASTAMGLLAGALRDSPGSNEQAAVNGWLGRADRRYSRTFAPPPPGRPRFHDATE